MVLYAILARAALPLDSSGGSVLIGRGLDFRADACQCTSATTQRSAYGIVWGCLTTIFACTWLAIHPNIPSPKDSRWRILLRRFMIMAIAIVVPEYTTVWAIRQWRAAKRISKEISQSKEFPEWTMTHSFFLIMGGFMLVDETGQPCHPLQLDELLDLKDQWGEHLKVPSEKEIQDRSKGDALSKTLILLHTTWFLLQVLARPIYGLHITELELVTVAFASLNVLAYAFWYNKPLNVDCSVQMLPPTRAPAPHLQRDPPVFTLKVLSHIQPASSTRQVAEDHGNLGHAEAGEMKWVGRDLHASEIAGTFQQGTRPSSPTRWMKFNISGPRIAIPLATHPFPQVKHTADPPINISPGMFDDNFSPDIENASESQLSDVIVSLEKFLYPMCLPDWMKFDVTQPITIASPPHIGDLAVSTEDLIVPPLALPPSCRLRPASNVGMFHSPALYLGSRPSTSGKINLDEPDSRFVSIPLVDSFSKVWQCIAPLAQQLMRTAFLTTRAIKRHLRRFLSLISSKLMQIVLCPVNVVMKVRRWNTQSLITAVKNILAPRVIVQQVLRPNSSQSPTSSVSSSSRAAMRVPTFYCGPEGSSVPTFAPTSTFGLLQILMAIYFGGLHCVAWNFNFPTRELGWLWITSAFDLTSIPLLLPLYIFLLRTGSLAYLETLNINWSRDIDDLDDRMPSSMRKILSYTGISFVAYHFVMHGRYILLVSQLLLIYLYFISRITLIILPFILLRDLSLGTLEEVEWTKYIPHISSWMFPR